MKRFFNFLLLCALSVGLTQTLQAQTGSQDDSFVFRVTGADGSIVELSQTDCELRGTADWAGSIDNEFCLPIVWGYDNVDSLFCNPSPNDYTGKMVVVRRGVCEFGAKGLNAQNAGAAGVLVLNHYATATEDQCFRVNMGAGAVGAQVTIPMISGSRAVGERLDAIISAGGAEVCFVFLRMSRPTAASMYATPLSQVAEMNAITVTYNNRSGADQTDVNLKAEFIDPDGNVTGSVTYNMPFCAPGVDSFIVFPGYFQAPAKGKHTVRFTNDKFTESIDTVYSYFEHTDYTFATDNLELSANGVGPSVAQFETAGFYIQSGGLCLTGETAAKATYATFGITNIEQVYVPNDPSANIIGIAVYRADVDGNGTGDLSSSFVDDLSAGLVCYEEYEMTGNEINNNLIHVPLNDLITSEPFVTLDANDAYYISLLYDGVNAGTGNCVRFSSTGDVAYASFTGYPTTPLYLGSLFGGGWAGATVVQRLELEGFNPTNKVAEPKRLDASKFNISPNPANAFVNVELNLENLNPSVAISVVDNKGRMVSGTKVEKNFQNGVVNLNTANIPSGTYYLWIRTAEGSTLKPVAICH
jgi:hypothetical protein